MTRAEAKKKILHILLDVLESDDEALFGDLDSKGKPLMIDSQEWRAFDAARVELQREFLKRTR